MPDALTPDVTAQILALNTPNHPSLYAIDGPVITGWWNFADPALAQPLADGGASSNFRYIVTLKPDKHTYSCIEQDAGYNNGRLRAYRGYNRGVKVNAFTLLTSLIQRSDRKQRTGSATPAHEYTLEELKAPLRDVLESNGWKRTGLIK